jgi:hypothetical protein
VLAAYARHLATAGGRGGRPAAPATARVYMSMIRALARDLGLGEETAEVRIPRHEPGPPETLTDTDYANLDLREQTRGIQRFVFVAVRFGRLMNRRSLCGQSASLCSFAGILCACGLGSARAYGNGLR